MNFSFKRSAVIALIVILIVASFGGGAYWQSRRSIIFVNDTPTVASGNLGKPDSVDFAPFWRAWNILNQKYVPTHGTSTGTTTEQDRVWGAIKGLADSYGDPYTTFFPPKESKQFQTEISGNFEGIGMEVGKKNGIITVVAPLKNTPAYKAGIKSGDMILKINDTSTIDMDVDQAVSLIRGKKGTPVRLQILHENAKQPTDVTVIRDVINIPTIDTKLRSDGIFIISLYNFSENSATLFRNALQELINSHSNKLIIDLRGNPGGYLESAVDIASWFLPADKVVVKEDSAGHSIDNVYKSRGYNIFNNNLKLVILVDGGSASASEILAGALREQGVTKLVGAKTFGKGSVQQLIPLTNETSLKVTVARWLTPNGVSISEQGLKPDYEVALTPDDIEAKKDPQMDKAVQILLGK